MDQQHSASEQCFPKAKPISEARIPRYVLALLKSLQFSDPNKAELQDLSDDDLKRLLEFCDAAQMTLLLGNLCRDSLPTWVQTRIRGNYENNARRFERLKAAAIEISDALVERSIEFALLKGFAHSPTFTPDPLVRTQGDIDIWCLPEQVFDARDALCELGYRSIARSNSRHLDPMARDSHWKWRGDYFDPELPIPVDLHYTLWDEEMERTAGLREHEVWARRSNFLLDNCSFPGLAATDTLAFAALHLIMHVFHGDLRLHRAWEIAYVLHNTAADETFWRTWRNLYSPQVQKLQFVAFLLADRWFQCGVPRLIAEEAQAVASDIWLWTERYGFSPIEALFVPNKDEVWLNLCLLNSFTSKASVLYRRLIPISSVAKRTSVEESPKTQSASRIWAARIQFIWQRILLHVRTFVPTCVRGLEWWWLRRQLGRQFLTFLLVSLLFDFGEFIFFLLYNLYLLDKHYEENFLGQISAAVTAGTLLAILPVAALTRRLGLRRAVLIAIVGTATATTLRSIVVSGPALLFCAFLNGLFMSFWAVSLPPVVAGLTNAKTRTLGFSLITSIGIGAGSVAGLIGGRLPGVLMHFNRALASTQAKQIALLAGSGLAAVALVPALLLVFPAIQIPEAAQNTYPRSRFVYSFLIALFVWSFGTGGFNPFFNAYFSRHNHMSVETIGSVFSYGQLAQVVVILLAPAVLKRFGQVRGIACMQVATAVMLALLAVVVSPSLAAIIYIAYMCFQYMSEPCLLSMLIEHVAIAEQSGASALHFMVIALAGIIAAVAAGAMLSRSGYYGTLSTCSIVTAVAAGMFYWFVRPGTHK